MQALVVEDDPKIAEFIRGGLEAEGHRVDVATDGESALQKALSGRHDLMILDLMLPRLDGLEILRQVRVSRPSLPVIAVTARGRIEDRVRGLDLGADDYLVKPFSFAELMARVRALFRRSSARLDRTLEAGGFALDRVERRLRFGDTAVILSSRESQLMELFLTNPDAPLSRATIADRVWGYQFDTGTNVIDVYVNYLRKRLRELGTEPIRTIRGVGYVFEPRRNGATEATP